MPSQTKGRLARWYDAFLGHGCSEHREATAAAIKEAVDKVKAIPIRRFARARNYFADAEQGAIKLVPTARNVPPAALVPPSWMAVPASNGAEWLFQELPGVPLRRMNAFYVLAPAWSAIPVHKHPQSKWVQVLWGRLIVTTRAGQHGASEVARELEGPGGPLGLPSNTFIEPGCWRELKAEADCGLVMTFSPPLGLVEAAPAFPAAAS